MKGGYTIKNNKISCAFGKQLSSESVILSSASLSKYKHIWSIDLAKPREMLSECLILYVWTKGHFTKHACLTGTDVLQ